MGICENVQSLCKKNKLPVSHLEKELSLANGSIRRWNDSSPSIDKLQKVADYFKVSIDYLIYGFHRAWLAAGLKIIKGERTLTQFAKDTGIDENELHELCAGTAIKQPSIETIAKIITDNNCGLPPNNEIFEAAGYNPDEIPLPPPVKKKDVESEDKNIFSAVARAKDLPVHDKKIVADMLDTLIASLLEKKQ